MKTGEQIEAEFYENNPPRRKKTTQNNEDTKGGECSKCEAWKGGDFGMNGDGVQSRHQCAQNNVPWEENIRSVARPSNTTKGGYEVVYDPDALIEQIKDLFQKDRTTLIGRVGEMMLPFSEPSKSGNREMDGWYNHALVDVLALLKEDSTSAF